MECFDIIFGMYIIGSGFIAGVLFEKQQNDEDIWKKNQKV